MVEYQGGGGWCDYVMYGVFVLVSFHSLKIIAQIASSGKFLGSVFSIVRVVLVLVLVMCICLYVSVYAV